VPLDRRQAWPRTLEPCVSWRGLLICLSHLAPITRWRSSVCLVCPNCSVPCILQAGLFGCLGLTFGLLVEVLLLIIRTNRPASSPEGRYPELFNFGRAKTKDNALRDTSILYHHDGPLAAEMVNETGNVGVVHGGGGEQSEKTSERSHGSGSASKSRGTLGNSRAGSFEGQSHKSGLRPDSKSKHV